jgi:hypothetical protein
MEESVTYQALINKGINEGIPIGRLEAAKRVLLRLGSKKFGPPDEATWQAVEEITDL